MTLYSRVSGRPLELSATLHDSSELEAPSSMLQDPSVPIAGPSALPLAFGAPSTSQSHAQGRPRTRKRDVAFPAPRGVPRGTMLDCLYDTEGKGAVLWVLDVLQWGGRDYTECNADFR